jgi:uncharacterized protein
MKRIVWIILGWIVLMLSAHAASFDCAKAASKVEKLICSDAGLSKLDEELNVAYKTALQDAKQTDTIKQAQKQWMKERNSCADVGCVKQAYEERLSTLSLSNGDSYTLEMSKDDKLCNAMLVLYNEDMKTYNSIRYDQHEIFASIKWQADKKLELKHAFFDINNDGDNELVIKDHGMLSGRSVDTLFIYPADSDIFSKLKPGWMPALFDTPNQLFSTNNNTYDLKALPKTSEFWVGVSFVLEPFTWKGASYISMTDDRPRWIVIAKYRQAAELQDICYFFDPTIKHQR